MSKTIFTELPINEQDIMMAQLNHAIRNDHNCLDAAYELLGLAESKGLFDNVKFGHEAVYTRPDDLADLDVFQMGQ